MPLLHLPRIKVKVAGNRSSDTHIVATKMFKDFFIATLHTNNDLKGWFLKSGKYTMVSR